MRKIFTTNIETCRSNPREILRFPVAVSGEMWMIMNSLALAASFVNRFDAEVAQSSLESHGIWAHVDMDDAGGFNPAIALGSQGSRLFVQVDDLSRALNILQENTAQFDENELVAEAMSYDPPTDV